MKGLQLPCVLLALSSGGVTGEQGGVGELNRLLETSQYEAAIEVMRLVQDLNGPDENGDTPLTVAARFDKPETYDMVHALLVLGADPNRPNAEGETPLHMAAQAGILSAVHLLVDGFGARPDSPRLVEGEDPDTEDTPIVRAAGGGHPRVVRFLESRGARFPEGREFEMRYELAASVHQERLLAASETNILDDPFLYNKIRAKAISLTVEEMGAPARVVEWERERVRAIEELSQDPAWEGRNGFDLYLEATEISWDRMRGRSGFTEQLKAWDRRKRGVTE